MQLGWVYLWWQSAFFIFQNCCTKSLLTNHGSFVLNMRTEEVVKKKIWFGCTWEVLRILLKLNCTRSLFPLFIASFHVWRSIRIIIMNPVLVLSFRQHVSSGCKFKCIDLDKDQDTGETLFLFVSSKAWSSAYKPHSTARKSRGSVYRWISWLCSTVSSLYSKSCFRWALIICEASCLTPTRFPLLYVAQLACERDYIGLAATSPNTALTGDLGIATEKVS